MTPEPTPSAQTPESTPPANSQQEFIDKLIAFDEQLRQGIASPWPSDGEPTNFPDDIAQCLQMVERVWPRNASRAANDLPQRIGRFHIHRVLGSGGFGIVYLASDPLLNRQVALKVPRLRALSSDRLRLRFEREAAAAAALDHPGIVPIHETGSDGPIVYIASAYCDGPNLAQWLALQEEPVSFSFAARLVAQLAQAMHYSHERGIVHRDLKPSNVLLFPGPGGALIPRITDFGLAHMVDEDLQQTGTSGIIGTPLYMAPEQALSRMEDVGESADIYALGVILYELIAKRPPFLGELPLQVLDQVRHTEPAPLRNWRDDVPRDLETIALRCLQKRPEDRYLTAEQLAEDLTRFLHGQPIVARRVSLLERFHNWCRQPGRMVEAGLLTMAVNALVSCQLLITVGMALAGIIPTPSRGEAAFHPLVGASASVVVMHLPVIVMGWWTMARRRWAIVGSLLSGVLMTALSGLFVFGVLPVGSAMWDDVPGFRAVYGLLFMLFIAQTVSSAIAWQAWRSQA